MYSSLSQSQISGLYGGRKKHATFILDVATYTSGRLATHRKESANLLVLRPARPSTNRIRMVKPLRANDCRKC